MGAGQFDRLREALKTAPADLAAMYRRVPKIRKGPRLSSWPQHGALRTAAADQGAALWHAHNSVHKRGLIR